MGFTRRHSRQCQGTPQIFRQFSLMQIADKLTQVTSTQPDLHSGMQGGVVHEPVLDLVRVLASLVDDDRRISIPGFYDGVAPVTDEEDALYARIIQHFSGTSSKTLLKHSHVDDPRSHLITKFAPIFHVLSGSDTGLTFRPFRRAGGVPRLSACTRSMSADPPARPSSRPQHGRPYRSGLCPTSRCP